jgi:hypothetical protein
MLISRRLSRFNSRLEVLRQLLCEADKTRKRELSDVFAAEKAIIQMQIEWETFTRNLILDSAIGKFCNSSGKIHSKTYSELFTREAAAHKLITLYPRRSKEPDWYLPAQAIDAATRLNISNLAQISAELGISPWPIDELRHVRNFISHKSKRAALHVRASKLVTSSKKINALDIVFEYDFGGVKRYESWINFAQGVAARLVS